MKNSLCKIVLCFMAAASLTGNQATTEQATPTKSLMGADESQQPVTVTGLPVKLPKSRLAFVKPIDFTLNQYQSYPDGVVRYEFDKDDRKPFDSFIFFQTENTEKAEKIIESLESRYFQRTRQKDKYQHFGETAFGDPVMYAWREVGDVTLIAFAQSKSREDVARWRIILNTFAPSAKLQSPTFTEILKDPDLQRQMGDIVSISAPIADICKEEVGALTKLESLTKFSSYERENPLDDLLFFPPFKCELPYDDSDKALKIIAGVRPDIKKLTAPKGDSGAVAILDRKDAQLVISQELPLRIKARRIKKIDNIPVLFEANPTSLGPARAFLDLTDNLDLSEENIARPWKRYLGKFSSLLEIQQADGLYKFSFKNDAFSHGVISESTNIIIPPTFENIAAIDNGFIVQNKNKLFGLFAHDGEKILAPEYRSISDLGDDILRVIYANYQEQVFDTKARSFRGARYDDLDFIKGQDLVIAKNGESFLFLTRDMVPAFEGVFDRIIKLSGSSFIVEVGGKEGLIDSAGQPILPISYDRLWPHHKHGLLFARSGEEKRYFDYNGKAISPPGWNVHYAPSVEKGYITVSDPSGRFGVISKSGDIVIAPQYSQVHQFSGGYLPAAIITGKGAERRQRFGLVDESGRTILPFVYQNLQLVFDDRLWARRDGKWGLIDVNNNIIANFTLDSISRYQEIKEQPSEEKRRLMVASRDGLYGIVRYDTGEVIIPFNYEKGRPGFLELREGDKRLSYPCDFKPDHASCLPARSLDVSSPDP